MEYDATIASNTHEPKKRKGKRKRRNQEQIKRTCHGHSPLPVIEMLGYLVFDIERPLAVTIACPSFPDFGLSS